MKASSTLLRKLITLPSLSPSHTSSRILSLLLPSKTHVIEYQPVLVLQCSADLIADPAMRKFNLHMPRMLLESLEEGTVRWKDDLIVADDDNNNGEEEKWYDVGTVIGEIIEDDEIEEEEVDVEEWAWQAYLDEKDDE